jgi:hypothetical protein
VCNGSKKPEKYETAEEIQIWSVWRLTAFTTFISRSNFVTTIVASLLPIVAIVVLSKLHKQSMILGFIALFTSLFTIGLTFLAPSGTSRTEIFTASAA